MSVKIKAITLHDLRNSANFQFHVAAAALITEFDPNKLGVAPLFATYQTAVEREDEAYKKIAKSEFTAQIEDADKARDKVYSNITAIIKTTLKHHNPDVVAAAKRLKIVIDTYGKINQKSYNEQTGDVYNILQEFRGKYAADIELIRIPELVDELERTNKAVDALITERDVETAAKNPETMKEARADSDAAYHAIEERINAAVVMEGPENYAEFITRLNVIIDHYKLLLAKSHHHEKKHDDTEE